MSSNFFKKNKKNFEVHFLDVLFFALSLTVVIFSFLMLRNKKSTRIELIIQTTNETYVYDLSKDRTIEVQGDIGFSKVEIKNHSAKFLDSPCPNKTCVHSSAIYTAGQWSACLPNQVFLRIEGDDDSTIDAIAQ